MDDERKYWLGFSAFPGIGPLRFQLLYDYFGSAKKAWHASQADLLETGLGVTLTAKFDGFRRQFSLAGYQQKVRDAHVWILLKTDDKYPALLKEITDAPFLLYIIGRKKTDDELWDITQSLAIVGTRRITPYGTMMTKQLATGIVQAGMTVVSGLALGVDAVAHEAAMIAGGKTIAVLGCGVDCCHPKTNQFLYDRIINGNGCIVSEFPLSQQASVGVFPARNRIISGLSRGVVVTEGAEDSGSLITAAYAAEQGRDVFAVPGPVTSPYSKASSKLLRQGAVLVESVEDILCQYQLSSSSKKTHAIPVGENPVEDDIIKHLAQGSLSADELIRNLHMGPADLISILSTMELRGIIHQQGGLYSIV